MRGDQWKIWGERGKGRKWWIVDSGWWAVDGRWWIAGWGGAEGEERGQGGHKGSWVGEVCGAAGNRDELVDVREREPRLAGKAVPRHRTPKGRLAVVGYVESNRRVRDDAGLPRRRCASAGPTLRTNQSCSSSERSRAGSRRRVREGVSDCCVM